MGVADVEANYAVVKAYQFTNLTSIQVSPDSDLLSEVFHAVLRELYMV